MKLVDDVGFDHSFSFIYSPRPGTPAAELPDDTPREVKLARLQRLQERARTSRRRRSASAMVGTRQRVLVEGASQEGSRRTCRPHRQQPRGQFPGRRAA